MQTYAVVDIEFRFVKVGRTTDIESRLSALNTASPLPLILMATADGDIEQSMHRLLAEHHQRLEWFHYNEEVEGTIIAAMSPTSEWFRCRHRERTRRKSLAAPEQMKVVPMAALTPEQRDRMSGVVTDSDRMFRRDPFGIPSDAALAAVIARRNKRELLDLRRTLSACGVKARELAASSRDPADLAAAAFAIKVIGNWRRRVGMELGSLLGVDS